MALTFRCRHAFKQVAAAQLPLRRFADAAKASAPCVPDFDPENGEVIFASSDTKKLVSSWLLLSLCQQRLLVDLGAGVLGQSWICRSPDRPLSRAILAAVRETAFAHFCGGESLEDCVPLAKQLQDAAGVRCIVDWGVEESCDPGAWESNADRKVDTLFQAKKILGASAAFMPIKPTSLLSPVLLERITTITEGGASKLSEDFRGQLAPADRLEVDEALSRLRRICQAAKDAAVPLLLDAEHSHRQPAVHLLAQQLQKEFNRDEAVVYDTIQMSESQNQKMYELDKFLGLPRPLSRYLAASPGRLEKAKQDNYTCAIKLVRGSIGGTPQNRFFIPNL
ncbi:prodh [Symbiodinium sp. CCMP2592]|nr:prodh [Symbiodinium sp. CCMP2592]